MVQEIYIDSRYIFISPSNPVAVTIVTEFRVLPDSILQTLKKPRKETFP
jgi:hypothetical protein